MVSITASSSEISLYLAMRNEKRQEEKIPERKNAKEATHLHVG